jgi:hypothetical protein
VAEALRGDAYVLGRSLSTVSSGAAQLVGLAPRGAAVAALGPVRALLVTAGCHLVAATMGTAADCPRSTSSGDGGDGGGDGGERRARRCASGELRETGRSYVGSRRSGRGRVWRAVTGRPAARPRDVRALLLVQWLPPGVRGRGRGVDRAVGLGPGLRAGVGGLLLAVRTVGMLVGSLVMGRWCGRPSRERLVAPVLVAVGSRCEPARTCRSACP